MYTFEVGKPYPLHNRARGTELSMIETNTASFDLLYYILKPSNGDIKIWKNGTMRYGVYIKNYVPFFLVDFPAAQWNFDVSFNFHKVQHDQREALLRQQGNLINFYLINANTNIIEAMRAIGILPEVIEKFKASSGAQLKTYANYNQVDDEIDDILTSISTNEMIKSVSMTKIEGR